MKDLAEVQKLLAASSLFRDIQPEEATAILARLQPSHHARGMHILERGQWHGLLYIIATGYVSVLLPKNGPTTHEMYKDTESSAPEEHILARLGPGECFGEMSLITGEPPTATIRVEQDVTLLSLAQTDFLALIGTCPTLSRNINTILTRRLSRTNQQIAPVSNAEVLWLSHTEQTNAPQEQNLAYHIAAALAWCSHKRVLLLELSGQDTAIATHFATSATQIRPTLLECSSDHSNLHAHEAPTYTPTGTHFPAVTTLTLQQEEAETLHAGFLTSLTDLAMRYDYLLLVTTPATPTQLIPIIAEQCQRAIFVVSATAEKQFTMPLPEKNSTIFVSHISEQPTIGLQDRYAAKLGYPVTRLLPADNTLLAQCWQARQPLQQFAPRAELTLAIQFVARHIAHQTLGIAFGGGGARGFAHLGVLERLLHYGIPLDYISACSSGIITPGMYLLGKSLAESEEIFLNIQRHLVQWSFPRTSIFSNKGLKHILENLCGDTRFEDLTTPFAMVAVDLTTHAGVVLERGPLWQAALASVALPGIFPPVHIGEHILVDAGMHDPVPIRLVRQMGADILLASELGEQEPPSLTSATPWILEAEAARARGQKLRRPRAPYIVDVLLRSYDIALATVGMHSIREADIVMRPKLHHISLRQFSEGRKFIAAGREAVEQALPTFKKRLPWL
nr:cyclic nucleotide-binding and patatin-like phospholipase domain-containing protein [Ktedonobacteraceae bacterium]